MNAATHAPARQKRSGGWFQKKRGQLPTLFTPKKPAKRSAKSIPDVPVPSTPAPRAMTGMDLHLDGFLGHHVAIDVTARSGTALVVGQVVQVTASVLVVRQVVSTLRALSIEEHRDEEIAGTVPERRTADFRFPRESVVRVRAVQA